MSGKAIIEASSPEEVLLILGALRLDFCHMSATEPVRAADGKYVSCATFSNDTTIIEVRPECG